MESLLELDHIFFHFLNQDCKNAFFDWLLPFWRNKFFWIPFYFFILTAIFRTFGKKGWWLVGGLVLAVSIADITSSHLIKNLIQRIRPCNQIGFKETAHLLVPCGSGYSFTSSHATNHFTVAIFLMLTIGRHWKWIRLPLLIWATSIALAQVYVGVHYPSDVLAGGIVGTFISLILVYLLKKLGILQLQAFTSNSFNP